MGAIGGTSPASPLRLVTDQVQAPSETLADREAVRRANAESARLDSADARAIIAARVEESLEGGRAAILRPERRARLMDLATRLGLRAFDASLIIAIVQDGARRGEATTHHDTDGRLRLVREPERDDAWMWSAVAAITLGMGLAIAMVAWFVAGG